MDNHEETHEGLKGPLNSVNHPLLHRLFLKPVGFLIIGISALRRLLVGGKKKPVSRDRGVDFIFIDPPYCGGS